MTLMLHAGGKPVTYDELRGVPLPEATDTPEQVVDIAPGQSVEIEATEPETPAA